jgi:hypothetical protein
VVIVPKAIGPRAIVRTVTVPAAIEEAIEAVTGAATVPVAAGHSKWRPKSSWKS